MLADPRHVREAALLAEILKPPVSRRPRRKIWGRPRRDPTPRPGPSRRRSGFRRSRRATFGDVVRKRSRGRRAAPISTSGPAIRRLHI